MGVSLFGVPHGGEREGGGPAMRALERWGLVAGSGAHPTEAGGGR
jgi:hypothetical protein